jgi:Protein of unknown function (DUF3135)
LFFITIYEFAKLPANLLHSRASIESLHANNKGRTAAKEQQMPAPQSHTRPEFDAWARLAREDPQAFEQQRNELLEQAILDAPARLRQRLRGLQWKLDRIRATSATPLAASIRMQQLLWDSVTGPQGLLARLRCIENPPTAGKTSQVSANILKFPR